MLMKCSGKRLENEKGRGSPLPGFFRAALTQPLMVPLVPRSSRREEGLEEHLGPVFHHSPHLLSQRVTASALKKNIFIFQVFISSAFECWLREIVSEDHHSLRHRRESTYPSPSSNPLPVLLSAIMFN